MHTCIDSIHNTLTLPNKETKCIQNSERDFSGKLFSVAKKKNESKISKTVRLPKSTVLSRYGKGHPTNWHPSLWLGLPGEKPSKEFSQRPAIWGPRKPGWQMQRIVDTINLCMRILVWRLAHLDWKTDSPRSNIWRSRFVSTTESWYYSLFFKGLYMFQPEYGTLGKFIRPIWTGFKNPEWS